MRQILFFSVKKLTLNNYHHSIHVTFKYEVVSTNIFMVKLLIEISKILLIFLLQVYVIFRACIITHAQKVTPKINEMHQHYFAKILNLTYVCSKAHFYIFKFVCIWGNATQLLINLKIKCCNIHTKTSAFFLTLVLKDLHLVIYISKIKIYFFFLKQFLIFWGNSKFCNTIFWMRLGFYTHISRHLIWINL